MEKKQRVKVWNGTVYKVLCDVDGTLKSYCYMHAGVDGKKIALEYKVGEKQIPQVGLLFAFESLEHTIICSKGLYDVIYKCKATGIRKPVTNLYKFPFPVTAIEVGLEEVWKSLLSGGTEYCNGWTIYTGSLWCKSITPIEQIIIKK